MPTYNFLNKKTNESFSKEMKISELDDYLKSNPDLQQTLQVISLVSPYSVGRTRTDSQFRDRLNKIKERNPGSTIRGDNLTEI